MGRKKTPHIIISGKEHTRRWKKTQKRVR